MTELHLHRDTDKEETFGNRNAVSSNPFPIEIRSYQDIGKAIKRIRFENGWKQYELAEMMGVTQATISNWEKGVYEPTTIQLMRLQNLCHLPIHLIGYEPRL